MVELATINKALPEDSPDSPKKIKKKVRSASTSYFLESGLSPGSALFMVASSTMWFHPVATMVM